jgi:hypothetical protein
MHRLLWAAFIAAVVVPLITVAGEPKDAREDKKITRSSKEVAKEKSKRPPSKPAKDLSDLEVEQIKPQGGEIWFKRKP